MHEKEENSAPSYATETDPGLSGDPMPQATSPTETPESAVEEAPPEPTTDANVQPKEPEPTAKEEPVITIRGLTKSFTDHDVLRGVDLHVNKGENLVILGKSGTGKSVLIKCLVGLERADSGTIEIFQRVPLRSVQPNSSGPKPIEKTSAWIPKRRPTQ